MANCKPDFLGLDFDGQDFFTSLMRKSFIQSMFAYLPVYFKEFDTYKDNFDRGFLERYLIAHGWEIDENIIPFINCYLDIIEAKTTDSKFLNHIADVLGNPPDIFQDDSYRSILQYAITIYKVKGTRKSYELFFSLLGFEVDIYEVPWTTGNSLYDSGGNYDNNDIVDTYDKGGCQHCTYYDIIFYSNGNNSHILTPGFIEKVRNIIKFLQPIDVKLRNLDFGLTLRDELEIEVTDESEEEVILVPQLWYDDGKYYDDGEEYDKSIEAVEYMGLAMMELNVIKNSISQIQLLADIGPLGAKTFSIPPSLFTIKFIKGNQVIHQASGQLVSYIIEQNVGPNIGHVSGKLISQVITLPVSTTPQDYDTLLLEGQLFNSNGDICKLKQYVAIGKQKIKLYYYKNE